MSICRNVRLNRPRKSPSPTAITAAARFTRGETVYNIDGQLIHEDCLHDFADDYFKDCKEEAVSYAEAYC